MIKTYAKVFLLLICFGALSCEKQSKKERIAALNNSVFCISIIVKTKESEKRVSVGTGFLVADGLLATASHVQPKAEELSKYFQKAPYEIIAWKRFNAGEVLQFPIKLAAKDEKNDLAVYGFDSKTLREHSQAVLLKPLALAEKLPAIGEEVVSAGYYGEYEMPFNSIGNVAMIDREEDIFSDLTLMPGNSGSPVCSLETGEVLGINTNVLDLGNQTVRFGIAENSMKLKELLKKL